MPRKYKPRRRVPVTDRFWSKVDRNGPIPAHRSALGPCWCWTAYRTLDGYGKFRYLGRARLAHVVAYILTAGHEPPPETPKVTHLCDGGSIGCVRPSHLMPDTQAGNVKQAVERGRVASGDRNGSRTHPEAHPRGDAHHFRTRPETVLRGEHHLHARLTDDLVRDIRRRYATGSITQKTLAIEYGVTRAAISALLLRRNWKHVS